MSLAEATNAPPARPGLAPEDEPLFEVVGDEIVELLPMGASQIVLANKLKKKLDRHLDGDDRGLSVVEVLFRISSTPNLQRRPDAAFVSYDRWARDRPIPDGNAWDVVPDLVVEVVSPNDYAEEVVAKLIEYFDAGVRLAWLVYPKLAKVYIYTTPDEIRVVNRRDTLEGGSVLPGFRLPLAELFAEPEAKP